MTFINNMSTEFCQITLRIKRFIHKRKVVPFFLPHGVDLHLGLRVLTRKKTKSTAVHAVYLNRKASVVRQSCMKRSIVETWMSSMPSSTASHLIISIKRLMMTRRRWIWPSADGAGRRREF